MVLHNQLLSSHPLAAPVHPPDRVTGPPELHHLLGRCFSPKAYNGKVGLALFCPVTSSVKGYPFEVALPEGSGVIGVVLADQLKSLDWRARKAKLIERASSQVLAMVTARLLTLIVPDSVATL
ncbi:type II toxin-antitoxin system PemK/MazF family toxin [Synechococcus sp. 1G10]|uniref:type II toxin-antitoxin system PemK/MazF family toxin n=1 Tax=Synechococcus sp. 1G10 TaxID=2025605 RepID=UPI000B99D30F|nr:type II toxin-antitoxin system PemK/MazF family toxin [Synechococcus sp. 1G10]